MACDGGADQGPGMQGARFSEAVSGEGAALFLRRWRAPSRATASAPGGVPVMAVSTLGRCSTGGPRYL
eukprot:1187579-Pyramimonas_sp.AAC.1